MKEKPIFTTTDENKISNDKIKILEMNFLILFPIQIFYNL